jgi:hypothetical protein
MHDGSFEIYAFLVKICSVAEQVVLLRMREGKVCLNETVLIRLLESARTLGMMTVRRANEHTQST